MLGIFSNMTLAEFVKDRRGELRISQRELAKRSGLSPTYIANIELGLNPSTGKPISPTIDAMQGLAKGLSVPYEELDRVARGLSRYPAEPKRPMMNDEEAQAFIDSFAELSPEDRKQAREYLLFLKSRASQGK